MPALRTAYDEAAAAVALRETEHAAAQRRGEASHAAYYRGKAAAQSAKAKAEREAPTVPLTAMQGSCQNLGDD